MTERSEPGSRPRWFTAPIALIIAALILFGGGVFVGSALASHNNFQAQQARSLAQLDAAPDLQHTTTEVAGGGLATLVWSGQLGESAFIASGLPDLQNGKTYELWYLHDRRATPAGTFDPSSSGTSWRVLGGRLQPGDAVDLTVEAHSGATSPSRRPLVDIRP